MELPPSSTATASGDGGGAGGAPDAELVAGLARLREMEAEWTATLASLQAEGALHIRALAADAMHSLHVYSEVAAVASRLAEAPAPCFAYESASVAQTQAAAVLLQALESHVATVDRELAVLSDAASPRCSAVACLELAAHWHAAAVHCDAAGRCAAAASAAPSNTLAANAARCSAAGATINDAWEQLGRLRTTMRSVAALAAAESLHGLGWPPGAEPASTVAPAHSAHDHNSAATTNVVHVKHASQLSAATMTLGVLQLCSSQYAAQLAAPQGTGSAAAAPPHHAGVAPALWMVQIIAKPLLLRLRGYCAGDGDRSGSGGNPTLGVDPAYLTAYLMDSFSDPVSAVCTALHPGGPIARAVQQGIAGALILWGELAASAVVACESSGIAIDTVKEKMVSADETEGTTRGAEGSGVGSSGNSSALPRRHHHHDHLHPDASAVDAVVTASSPAVGAAVSPPPSELALAAGLAFDVHAAVLEQVHCEVVKLCDPVFRDAFRRLGMGLGLGTRTAGGERVDRAGGGEEGWTEVSSSATRLRRKRLHPPHPQQQQQQTIDPDSVSPISLLSSRLLQRALRYARCSSSAQLRDTSSGAPTLPGGLHYASLSASSSATGSSSAANTSSLSPPLPMLQLSHLFDEVRHYDDQLAGFSAASEDGVGGAILSAAVSSAAALSRTWRSSIFTSSGDLRESGSVGGYCGGGGDACEGCSTFAAGSDFLDRICARPRYGLCDLLLLASSASSTAAVGAPPDGVISSPRTNGAAFAVSPPLSHGLASRRRLASSYNSGDGGSALLSQFLRAEAFLSADACVLGQLYREEVAVAVHAFLLLPPPLLAPAATPPLSGGPVFVTHCYLHSAGARAAIDRTLQLVRLRYRALRAPWGGALTDAGAACLAVFLLRDVAAVLAAVQMEAEGGATRAHHQHSSAAAGGVGREGGDGASSESGGSESSGSNNSSDGAGGGGDEIEDSSKSELSDSSGGGGGGTSDAEREKGHAVGRQYRHHPHHTDNVIVPARPESAAEGPADDSASILAAVSSTGGGVNSVHSEVAPPRPSSSSSSSSSSQSLGASNSTMVAAAVSHEGGGVSKDSVGGISGGSVLGVRALMRGILRTVAPLSSSSPATNSYNTSIGNGGPHGGSSSSSQDAVSRPLTSMLATNSSTGTSSVDDGASGSSSGSRTQPASSVSLFEGGTATAPSTESISKRPSSTHSRTHRQQPSHRQPRRPHDTPSSPIPPRRQPSSPASPPRTPPIAYSSDALAALRAASASIATDAAATPLLRTMARSCSLADHVFAALADHSPPPTPPPPSAAAVYSGPAAIITAPTAQSPYESTGGDGVGGVRLLAQGRRALLDALAAGAVGGWAGVAHPWLRLVNVWHLRPYGEGATPGAAADVASAAFRDAAEQLAYVFRVLREEAEAAAGGSVGEGLSSSPLWLEEVGEAVAAGIDAILFRAVLMAGEGEEEEEEGEGSWPSGSHSVAAAAAAADAVASALPGRLHAGSEGSDGEKGGATTTMSDRRTAPPITTNGYVNDADVADSTGGEELVRSYVKGRTVLLGFLRSSAAAAVNTASSAVGVALPRTSDTSGGGHRSSSTSSTSLRGAPPSLAAETAAAKGGAMAVPAGAALLLNAVCADVSVLAEVMRRGGIGVEAQPPTPAAAVAADDEFGDETAAPTSPDAASAAPACRATLPATSDILHLLGALPVGKAAGVYDAVAALVHLPAHTSATTTTTSRLEAEHARDVFCGGTGVARTSPLLGTRAIGGALRVLHHVATRRH